MFCNILCGFFCFNFLVGPISMYYLIAFFFRCGYIFVISFVFFHFLRAVVSSVYFFWSLFFITAFNLGFRRLLFFVVYSLCSFFCSFNSCSFLLLLRRLFSIFGLLYCFIFSGAFQNYLLTVFFL